MSTDYWQVRITGPVDIEEWGPVLPEDEDPSFVASYYREWDVLSDVLGDAGYNPYTIDLDDLVIKATRRTEAEFQEWEATNA